VNPALLILNGPVADAAAVKRRAAAAGFVVCADGGAKVAQRLGLRPRVVIPMHAGRDIKPKTLHGILDDMRITPEQLKEL